MNTEEICSWWVSLPNAVGAIRASTHQHLAVHVELDRLNL